MLAIAIITMLLAGILWKRFLKLRDFVKEWTVFLMIEVTLFVAEYWKDILVGLIWILFWIYLLTFSGCHT